MKQTRLMPVLPADVAIKGGFLGQREETNRRVTLVTAYEQLKKTGTFTAYQWEWVPTDKPPQWRIWVGDLGKWIEAVSYSLARYPDPELQARMESVIADIIKGQKPDGFLYSNPMPPDAHWANLQELHQLYDVGHTIEGAVAHYQVTGREHFLAALRRCADLLADTFGRKPGQLRGYDGHPEIELALVRLYRATGEARYLDLAKYFVDERGQEPHYFRQERTGTPRKDVHHFGWYTNDAFYFAQSHKPVREQEDAVGHAVRALYLYSGMADVAAETDDAELHAVCKRLWKSITRRRMYVTGGIGSAAHGEAFTFDYDLPNETAYAETCASIALIFFAHRMLQVERDGEYADVMERALYNGVLSGVSLDGKQFFYGNRLTVYPKPDGDGHENVSNRRREWFGCCCCPPNLARLIASLGQYMYSTAPDALVVHLYGSSDATLSVTGGTVKLRQETAYPWDGAVSLTLGLDEPRLFELALRIPRWCRRHTLRINGKRVAPGVRKGYAYVRRTWQDGDRVTLDLAMPVERLEAHPRVRMDCGRVALQRGPVVYCLEEVDNGAELADVALPRRAALKAEFKPDLLGGCTVLRGKAVRRAQAGWNEALYRPDATPVRSAPITAVPYCLWGNRKPGAMLVWIRHIEK